MAAPGSSVRAVLAAVLGNGFVTLIKLGAFLLSGSGAMLSEAIHSFADTSNQVLLLVGLKRAAKEGDEDFQYGYGGERFVFGILSAAGIFFLGCGVTIYHGIEGILHPRSPELDALTFAALGIAFVIEGGVLVVALKALNEQRRGLGWGAFLRDKADPATVGVVLEDSAAVLGVIFAAGGILVTYLTGNSLGDAVATILIGILLGLVALFLVRSNRALLLGKAVPDGVEERFVAILRGSASVRDVHDVKTRQLTPEAYTLKAEVRFDPKPIATRLDPVLPRDGAALVGEERERTLHALADAAAVAVAAEIDLLEEAIRAEIPEARHIDLEAHRLARQR